MECTLLVLWLAAESIACVKSHHVEIHNDKRNCYFIYSLNNKKL